MWGRTALAPPPGISVKLRVFWGSLVTISTTEALISTEILMIFFSVWSVVISVSVVSLPQCTAARWFFDSIRFNLTRMPAGARVLDRGSPGVSVAGATQPRANLSRVKLAGTARAPVAATPRGRRTRR